VQQILNVKPNKWYYQMALDGLTTGIGNPICPCCNEVMEQNSDGTYICINDDCPFILSEAVQAVITAMMDGVAEDYFTHGRVLEACEIARAYTLEEDTTFRIKDRESAGWYVKKLAKISATIDEITAEADARVSELQAEIDAINQRREDALKAPERDLIYLTARYQPELEEWARSEIADGKTKSVKLSYGTVGVKKSPDKLVIDDEAAAILFAQNNEIYEAFKVEKKILKPGLLGWLKENEMVEIKEYCSFADKDVVLAHIEPGSDEFYVKANLPVTEV